MKIVTEHTYPPIPVRDFDYHAWLDGHEEDGMYGRGKTEAEAVKDLLENWGDTFCFNCYSQIFAADCKRVTDSRDCPGWLVCHECGSDKVERIEK